MIIITGQTATGKTKLALEYAQKYNGELVNFDSRQIYKYLDIITGKDIPKNSKLKTQNSKFRLKNKNYSIGYYKIPIKINSTDNQPLTTKIWLYDIVEPDQYFSSFEYIKIAQKVIKDIISRNKTPILIGGTYFYLKHFLYGFDFSVPPNFKLREELNKKSVKELQKILLSLISSTSNLQPSTIKDQPPTTLNINQSDWQNPRRLIRRIEIENFKKLKSYRVIKKEAKIPFREKFSSKLFFEKMVSSYVGLKYKNKQNLIKAIKNRVEKRLEQGAVEEVKKVLQIGYKKTDPGLKTIGYKQIIEYLEGKTDLKTAIEKWITAEVQYAKRQYTFMKKDKNITWKQI